ncbi:MAG: amidohydrolase family protein, partial [Anaerolineae bacterium]
SSSNPVEAAPVSVADAGQEPYESVLITVEDVEVAQLLDYGEWVVTDLPPSSYLLCDDLNDYVYFPKPGDHLDSITGTLFYTYGSFKLEPRATDDITGEPIPHYALHGHVVTMNDAREVVRRGYVEILGDETMAIHRHRPPAIPVAHTGGLIFPGLIDSHNHPPYNVLDRIPLQETFTERYQWQQKPLYGAFQTQLFQIANYGGNPDAYAQYENLAKLAEVRALTAGTTAIQGVYGYFRPAVAHQGIVIDNIERYPTRAYPETFPLRQTEASWQDLATENWERFIIHLSEGTSEAALQEFYTWQHWGMLDARTTIIHGVPYGKPEWAAMAEVGAHLIWSPTSNLVLYGTTPDIPGALAAGVNVALAPDWTPSGARHILEELKRASRINTEQWGGLITPLQFAEFVTRNAADAAGVQRFMGQITPAYRANLMVIPGSPSHPYDDLLRAEPANVRLVVVDGRPMYGNPGILRQLDVVDGVETIRVGGALQGLAIQVEAHAIPESDRPFAEILTELTEAYEAAEPKVCASLGVDSAGPGRPHAWAPSASSQAVRLRSERPGAPELWPPTNAVPSVRVDPASLLELETQHLTGPVPGAR